MPLPDHYDWRATEARWRAAWEEKGVYRFNPADERPTFSIDTPPPTVSGSLHVGHVFSYTHTDLVARFQRMRGRNVFYPMGWDDNGLPSERRVQNLLKVRCEPHLPYEPEFAPDAATRKVRSVSRRNFLELCARVTAQDEKAYEELWRRLGLSVDWSRTYATIDERSRALAQLAFLDLVRRGEAYSLDAPTMWDVDFRTAVAQAEVEDRDVPGQECRLRFGLAGGGTLPIMTTRPELLAACVAVVVHPDDARYAALAGRAAITPGYLARVPILAHALADPAKGTGAAMVCTFGDATDVTWWEELGLPARIILGRDGRILPLDWGRHPWDSLRPDSAQALHDRLAGLPAPKAKRAIVDSLADPAAAADGTRQAPLEGPPRAIRQTVRCYEKGERPLEILITRQWFIRLLDKKDALVRQGRQVQWHPDWMRARYESWIEGLRYDWCVSRQRFHGVPIPVWYPLDGKGAAQFAQPILPPPARLPVDPMSEAPEGYAESQRDQPGGFTAEPDVLDTWATSSLTPQIACNWAGDEALFRRLYPMDLRPQAHEIIRTWAFYTIARAYMMDGRIPWRHIAISGWVMDPGRKKMSKSAGNVVTPTDLMDAYGADAIRYWAARARLGTDTAYDESAFKVGKRLVTKVFNVGKLVVTRLTAAGWEPRAASPGDADAPLDRAHLGLLADLVEHATGLVEAFETAAALEAIETWLWAGLCDNYLELTKARAYAGDRSALATWSLSLSAALRLLAPFAPYVTEEVWSWHHGGDGLSVHGAPWPRPEELRPPEADAAVFPVVVAVLGQIRRYRTEHRLSLARPIERVTASGPSRQLALLRSALDDLTSAAHVAHLDLCESAGPLTVLVEP